MAIERKIVGHFKHSQLTMSRLGNTDNARIVKKDAPTRQSDSREQYILYDVEFVSTDYELQSFIIQYVPVGPY